MDTNQILPRWRFAQILFKELAEKIDEEVLLKVRGAGFAAELSHFNSVSIFKSQIGQDPCYEFEAKCVWAMTNIYSM